MSLATNTCDYCYKNFKTITQLRRHASKHQCHPGAKTKLENSTINRKKYVKRDSVWRCEECGKVVSQLASFKRHMRFHERRRGLTCTKCDIRFRSETYLVTHMITQHNINPMVRNDVLITINREQNRPVQNTDRSKSTNQNNPIAELIVDMILEENKTN